MSCAYRIYSIKRPASNKRPPPPQETEVHKRSINEIEIDLVLLRDFPEDQVL